jgi:hypothetical protein
MYGMQQGSCGCACFYRVAAIKFLGHFFMAKLGLRVRLAIMNVFVSHLTLELAVHNFDLRYVEKYQILGKGFRRGKTRTHETPSSRRETQNNQASL